MRTGIKNTVKAAFNVVKIYRIGKPFDILIDKGIYFFGIIEKGCVKIAKTRIASAVGTASAGVIYAVDKFIDFICRHTVQKSAASAKAIHSVFKTGFSALENIGATSVNTADRGISRMVALCKRIYNKVDKEFLKVREYADQNKKPLLAGFATFCLVTVIGASIINHYTVYEYMYDGHVLGAVKSQDKVYETVDLVKDKLSKELGVEVKIDEEEDISFNRVVSFDEKETEVDMEEEILENFTHMEGTRIIGYAITVDKEEVCILESRESANELLDDVKKAALDGKSEKDFVDVEFKEDVSVRKIETRLSNLNEPEESFDMIMTGGKETKIHLVEAGDSMSKIASENGITVDELQSMNPEVDPAALYLSQEIKLDRQISLINIVTTETRTYKETVPYDIIYEDTDKTFVGQEFIMVDGIDGLRRVKAEIRMCNGVEVGRTEITSTTLKKPVSQEVLRGSRPESGPMSKGYFQYPTNGRLTSKFGERWGRNHNGIDLAASPGTPIYAAAGGVVLEADYQKSFGYVVKIDHGGGRTTLYAHCKELFVKAGDQILQGDLIAGVGNTGNSTGPHCHFEVQIDGVPVNPFYYL